MMLRVARVHFPVTVLGWGRRIGIWVQGCSIGCPGCVSAYTWPSDPDRLRPVDSLLAWCAEHGDDVDGVTLTGGEPFEQPEALGELIAGLRAWRETLSRPLDLLCYSGMPWARLQRDHSGLIAQLDAIIPEPFVHSRPTDARWRGSSNQPLIPLTDLGRARYEKDSEQPVERAHLQAMLDNGRLRMIGVPKRGELERIEKECAERGVELRDI